MVSWILICVADDWALWSAPTGVLPNPARTSLIHVTSWPIVRHFRKLILCDSLHGNIGGVSGWHQCAVFPGTESWQRVGTGTRPPSPLWGLHTQYVNSFLFLSIECTYIRFDLNFCHVMNGSESPHVFWSIWFNKLFSIKWKFLILEKQKYILVATIGVVIIKILKVVKSIL